MMSRDRLEPVLRCARRSARCGDAVAGRGRWCGVGVGQHAGEAGKHSAMRRAQREKPSIAPTPAPGVGRTFARAKAGIGKRQIDDAVERRCRPQTLAVAFSGHGFLGDARCKPARRRPRPLPGKAKQRAPRRATDCCGRRRRLVVPRDAIASRVTAPACAVFRIVQTIVECPGRRAGRPSGRPFIGRDVNGQRSPSERDDNC